MVQVSAVFVFAIGFVVGALIGVLGLIVMAFKYSKEDKDGRSKSKEK